MKVFFSTVFIFSFLTTFLTTELSAQSVVVSAYFNAASANDEWTELFVVNDDIDMRGWTIRDNNGNQQNWQTPVTFANVALWSHLRAGAIIVLWHRKINSSGAPHVTDKNKSDGYIELNVQDTNYFTGGSFGASLDIAGNGDIIQLRDAAGAHIHALAHKSVVDSCWNNLPAPKLNYKGAISTGDVLYVCPGSSINDYGTPAQNGTTYSTKSSTAITFGLPNTCGGAPTSNTTFWLNTRKPMLSTQTINPSVNISGTPTGTIEFTWAAATDPYPSDNNIGYLILQSTSNSFTAPTDGTAYTIGSTLGNAVVIDNISSSTTTSYADHSVVNGSTYAYRIYSYRYEADDINGNTYNTTRGRIYSSNFVSVNATPLPVSLLFLKAEIVNRDIFIHWATAEENNNKEFFVERSEDGEAFYSIYKINGAGTSSAQKNYSFTDKNIPPEHSYFYYRLKQIDFNGNINYSKIINVSTDADKTTNQISNYIIDRTEGKIRFELKRSQTDHIQIEITDMIGRVLLSKQSNQSGLQELDISTLIPGIYLLNIHDSKTKLFVIKWQW